MPPSSSSIVLKCLLPRPMARLRFLAAPFAGAGAAVFHDLARALPDWIEVWALQAPGREEQLSEPAFTEWPAFENALAATLSDWPATPTALYGHSLGALTALSAARFLTAKGRNVNHVFLAARPAPKAQSDSPFSAPPADNEALIRWLETRFGAGPASLSDPAVAAVVGPTLRADLTLLQSFETPPTGALACPVTAIIGARDPSMDAASAAAWADVTTGTFSVAAIEAGHYFLTTNAEPLAKFITDELSAP
ncbi:MAG: alpha/beta fold hydrolase [Pseudomonadota bacterium]